MSATAWHDMLQASPAGALLMLREVIDFADVLPRMDQLEAVALAMSAGREAPAFYDRDHVGVLRVVGDAIDPAPGTIRPNLNFWSMKHFGCKNLFLGRPCTAMFCRSGRAIDPDR